MKQSLLLMGVHRPRITLLLGFLLLGLLASGMPKLIKDTRADAFLADDNPALVYKNKIKDIFGISDPMVIAIEDRSSDGIYRTSTLALIADITETVNDLENINEDRTLSLATEDNIVGSEEGMEITPFFDLLENQNSNQNNTTVSHQAIRKAIKDFPLYDGMLVSHDDAMSIIVLELIEDGLATETYYELEEIIANIQHDSKVSIHLAGEAAAMGYLTSYIDKDAKRLNPLAALIITIMLVVAFRRLAPALLGNVVILASIASTIGFMASNGVPWYVITNSMPVILIGIAVADSIHIFSHYYESQAKHPERSIKESIEDAVLTMWRPVTLTTFTTMAGFFGLYSAAYMPPFEYYGLFTAFGVMMAWFYSLFVLPACISLIKPKVSKRWIALEQQSKSDVFSRIMVVLGTLATKNTKSTVIFFLLFASSGIYFSTQIQVNESRIDSFHKTEAIHQADTAINQRLEGTNTINIVVETPHDEGLFNTEVLDRIESLQHYAESLNHVNGSESLVDYLKQMNKSMNADQPEYFSIPNDNHLIAQYFLLYSASGDPTDLEHVVDYDYRLANIRLNLDTSEFVLTKPIIESLQNYIETQFNSEHAVATLSGRVNVNYHWIKDLGEAHFLSVIIALLCVLTVSVLLFQSMVAGLLAVTPVVCSILAVYTTMSLLGISLGIGTSMFASVAIGLGVDFAIHTIDRLKALFKDGYHHPKDIVANLYSNTGRALLFNYLAIAFGFGVLISSRVVPLNHFGTIVVLSVTITFITSMVLIPAAVLLFKPSFFYQHIHTAFEHPVHSEKLDQSKKASGFYGILALGLCMSLLVSNQDVYANTDGSSQSVLDVIRKINAVEEGEHVVSNLLMTTIDKRGKERQRHAVSYRKYFGDEKRTLLYYKKPSNVKGTGFLTYDYSSAQDDDDQWLYLPALKKVRRISSSDRGDYFLGTDFTYEDIKKSGKIEESDFNFSMVDETNINQTKYLKIRAVPKTDAVAKELGYGRSEFLVNTQNWIITKTDYWDRKGKPLKTYTATDIFLVDGIWTKHTMEVRNHKTGHYSKFQFSKVNYQTPVADKVFTKRAMKKGL